MGSTAFFEGMGLGAGLIVAIGAQNAFVLRQGLQRRHVLICVLICSVCDIALIALGVSGMGSMLAVNAAWSSAAKWGGSLFLIVYGARSARAALRPKTRESPSSAECSGYASVAASAFEFSLLNPHVYLDTVVLLGSIGARHLGMDRVLFATGAMLASILWFFSLGFGARFAAPVFAKPLAWRYLDGGIALIMWAIAIARFR
jgi:L-lysine exporter family protein LysE/ArgO